MMKMMLMLMLTTTLKAMLRAACDGRADGTGHRASETERTSCSAMMVMSMPADIIERDALQHYANRSTRPRRAVHHHHQHHQHHNQHNSHQTHHQHPHPPPPSLRLSKTPHKPPRRPPPSNPRERGVRMQFAPPCCGARHTRLAKQDVRDKANKTRRRHGKHQALICMSPCTCSCMNIRTCNRRGSVQR
jgi:hypothetical protein